ncbi:MAG: low molecular weight protein-tyrosine-phosphatase [Steroidobacteraceae bacterium]|jgi:protein-tyrosine phosphatase
MSRNRFKVLFVCLGNICRSPTAEGVLRETAARVAPQLHLEIDSAGTADYHVGSAPDPRSQRAALERGIDISGLRARQVTAEDFMDFDLILAMDAQNLSALRAISPPNARAQLRLFLAYAPQLGRLEVPDPYYGGAADFTAVLDLTSAASLALIASLEQAAQ